MRISYNSASWKICGFIRFLFCKAVCKNFKAKGLAIFGSRVSFFAIGKIDIGSKVILSNNVELQSRGQLTIGDNVFINQYSKVIAFKEIKIGSNVMLGQFVSILDHDHDYSFFGSDLRFNGYKNSKIEIGDNVWVGEKVTITKGANIGNNVIIAANSVVTGCLNSNGIYGGIPAKLIKEISN